MIGGMAALNDLSATALDELEAGLLADLEAVRRIRSLLAGRQPLVIPAAVLAALLPAGPAAAPVNTAEAAPPPPAAPAPAPYVPPPPHPNFKITDVRVAVRQVIDTLGGSFGISDVKRKLYDGHYREFGDSTLRATLLALQQQGEIALTSKGIGRGGNKYSKAAPAPPPDGPGAEGSAE